MRVYMNNAATSWPKPDVVAQAMSDFLINGGANLGRGTASAKDLSTMNMVLSCREKAAQLLGGHEEGHPALVTFTNNVTESLNIVLKGYLKAGMRVLTSSMEHNAVIRPLRHLEETLGLELEIIPCDGRGFLDPSSLKEALERKRADLAVFSHCSNVCGTLQDLEALASICAGFQVPLVVDSAQTAGVVPIDTQGLNLAALCFTGHKGLMGPQGTGGILWRRDFAEACEPFVEGGTGSFSHVELQPQAMPDKFESGTLNLPGIAGLCAALQWIQSTGMEAIHRWEMDLGGRLLEGLRRVPGLKLSGIDGMEGRLPVFALNFQGIDNGVLGGELSALGVDVRPGLQCSPWGHRTLGTFPEGALRISPGYFNSSDDVDRTLEALQEALRTLRS